MHLPTVWTVTLALGGCLLAWVFVNRWAVRIAEKLGTPHDGYSAQVVSARLNHLAGVADAGDKSIRQALEQLARGETPTEPAPVSVPPPGADQWVLLEVALHQSNLRAWQAVVHGWAARVSPAQQRAQQGQHHASRAQAAAADMSQVLVYLAGGLFALVVRALEILRERQKTVEDPDTLYDILDVDNLLRRIRRRAGRFAVLGGMRARTVNEPVHLLHLLRAAVAEIERYEQVRIPTPGVDVRIPGDAAPDLIHLLAELVENATLCSSPQSNVMVKAGQVPAGLLVEIEDRGLGLDAADLHRLNRILGAPKETDLAEGLAARQTGLLVVARLAARYQIRISLQQNFFGGVTANVIIPQTLLEGLAPLQGPHEVGTVTRVPRAVDQTLTLTAVPASRPHTSSASQDSSASHQTNHPLKTSDAARPLREGRTSAEPVAQTVAEQPGHRAPLPQRRRYPVPPTAPAPTPQRRSGAPREIRPDFATSFTAGVARGEREPGGPAPHDHADGQPPGVPTDE
ncbi:ATP-binding protein [Streptomyces mirabilis]|uniref:ATP-binding protein n=1 Tax=Streptomyces mirabilis TaxID=68239 RepID=UPI00367E4A17